MSRAPAIQLWLKLSYSAFIAVWMPLYWSYYGPQNFLWFCDLANFIILFALWLESPILLSSQLVSILLIQILWTIDFSGRALFGIHPIGGTEYMFETARPVIIRLFSLFHIATPLITLWAVGRVGYDRRGWILQTGIACIILPLSFFLTGPELNINWVWGLFGRPQTIIDPSIYLILIIIGYPLVIYLPTDLILGRLFKPR